MAEQIRIVEQTRAEQLETRIDSLSQRRKKLEDAEQDGDAEEYKTSFQKLTAKERMQIPRNPMPEQEPLVRARNFDEVPLGFNPEVAMREAMRCLECIRSLLSDRCR